MSLKFGLLQLNELELKSVRLLWFLLKAVAKDLTM